MRAISIDIPSIGYCQGLNVIIGILLMISGGKEVEVFWMFKIIAEHQKYYYKGIFDRNFSLLKLFVHFFGQALKKREDVQLISFFEGIPYSLWLHKWLITIVGIDFPHGSTLRVWDLFFMRGLR